MVTYVVLQNWTPFFQTKYLLLWPKENCCVNNLSECLTYLKSCFATVLLLAPVVRHNKFEALNLYIIHVWPKSGANKVLKGEGITPWNVQTYKLSSQMPGGAIKFRDNYWSYIEKKGSPNWIVVTE